jgi:alanine-glyoxylate transaminase/serine-glyoxylate transaminase/serine-pyruvate transaminase
VTFSAKALERLDQRKTKVTSWYLDMTMLRSYWGSDRVYHHTAPINMTYALREALQVVLEEGLQQRIARHEQNHRMLRAGLEAMGLTYVPQHSLTTLNAVRIMDGVDDVLVRRKLLQDYNIEIGAGLGPFKGKVWRFGLMGSSSTKQNVILVLSALGEILYSMGKISEPGCGLAAASEANQTAGVS